MSSGYIHFGKLIFIDVICVNIQLQLMHLLVAGRGGRGLTVIARKSLVGLTTLLVRRGKMLDEDQNERKYICFTMALQRDTGRRL